MRKVLLSVTILAGTCIFISAARDPTSAVNIEIAHLVGQDDGFIEIKLESLNENVQKAINAYSETCVIKVIGFNEEKKLTKVSFVSKTDESEEILIFDDEGKLIK